MASCITVRALCSIPFCGSIVSLVSSCHSLLFHQLISMLFWIFLVFFFLVTVIPLSFLIVFLSAYDLQAYTIAIVAPLHFVLRFLRFLFFSCIVSFRDILCDQGMASIPKVLTFFCCLLVIFQVSQPYDRLLFIMASYLLMFLFYLSLNSRECYLDKI